MNQKVKFAETLQYTPPRHECVELYGPEDLAANLPGRGAVVHAVTRRVIKAWRFVPAVLHAFGDCDRLMISSFNYSVDCCDMLAAGVEGGQIKTLDILVNTAMERIGLEAWSACLGLQRCWPERVRVKALNVHAKILCFVCGAECLVVEGSGNMANNANIEQYTVFNSAEVLHFHAGWINEVMRS